MIKTETEADLIAEAQKAYADINQFKRGIGSQTKELRDYKIARLGSISKYFEGTTYTSNKFCYFKLRMEKDLNDLAFEEWVDDNVIETKSGYSTQDSQYTNKIRTLKELREYYQKQFFGQTKL